MAKSKAKELEKVIEEKDTEIENLITELNGHKMNEEILKDIIIRLNMKLVGLSDF